MLTAALGILQITADVDPSIRYLLKVMKEQKKNILLNFQEYISEAAKADAAQALLLQCTLHSQK